jgi:hypothetical protein
MLLIAAGGEAPYHQAFRADAGRIAELGAALTRLRAERDWQPIDAFFRRHEAAQRAAERAVPLEVSARKWQARWLEVKDFLGSGMPSAAPPRAPDECLIVRKLGWVKLDRELGRARALRRVGAPSSVVAGQRDRVRKAFLATGWEEQHAPPPPQLPDLEFWSLPVQLLRAASAAPELRIGDLDPKQAEQQAWSRAQELVERGIELCIEPLDEASGLGGHATLDADGKLLIDTRQAAHPGWIEPSWRPSYRVGAAARELGRAVVPRADSSIEAVERVRARFAQAAERADETGQALVWWLDPAS